MIRFTGRAAIDALFPLGLAALIVASLTLTAFGGSVLAAQKARKSGPGLLCLSRIGKNEVSAIQACLAQFVAQRGYAAGDRNGDDLIEYARKFVSEPGKRDGLLMGLLNAGESRWVVRMHPWLGPMVLHTGAALAGFVDRWSGRKG